VEIRRAVARATSTEPGIRGSHCFSYGSCYDPGNVSFGPLIAANMFDLDPGAGFDTHEHAGVEIVTWVVHGELEHADSTGGTARLRAGSAGVLSAGVGMRHSERNAGAGPLRFVQLWLHPDPGSDPVYRCAEVDLDGPVSPIAAADAGPLRPRAGDVAVWVVRAGAGARVSLPAAARLWGLVLHGAVTVAGRPLHDGDEIRTGGPVGSLRAGPAGAQMLLVSVGSS
jgi:redox-sensitive bicupin YhaK (pirin superfamily)